LSGFAAEMTIFVGSWQNTDAFYRIATIIACMSIVVTAVYILRAIGNVAMGPIKESYEVLTDANWYEKTAAIVLLAGILAIGLAPMWLNDLIKPGAEIIMQRVVSSAP
jgi:NADH-quinone oxidoreductase subunit M